MQKTIVVLGGYGNFGKRISETLAQERGLHIILAGRNLDKANQVCQQLRQAGALADLSACCLDINAEEFPSLLKQLQPFLVIHTSGPFQRQDYRVPNACIQARAHYLDLADDRRFVCDIVQLDEKAKAAQLMVVSGASSVPGLSSTVINHFVANFGHIHALDIAIAPGNRAERGAATVKAILSYTGHPIEVFENGHWLQKYGWMSPRKLDFGPAVGKRWLANVDVPDLELFPRLYAPVKTVRFQAGLELGFLHWGMVSMAAMAKYGLVKNWAPLVKPIVAASNWFIGLGTDVGGMMITINGVDAQQQPIEIRWQLTAKAGVGPYIPTLSTIILARRLLDGKSFTAGASPCLAAYALDEFTEVANTWGIYHETFLNGTLIHTTKIK